MSLRVKKKNIKKTLNDIFKVSISNGIIEIRIRDNLALSVEGNLYLNGKNIYLNNGRKDTERDDEEIHTKKLDR